MFSRIIVETDKLSFHEEVTSSKWSGYHYCAHYSKGDKICIIFEKEEKKTKVSTGLTEEQLKSFYEFWALYPKSRRKAKPVAMRYWKKITNPKLVIDRLKLHLRTEFDGKESCFIPLVTTWLNGERWDDEIDETESPALALALKNFKEKKRANLNRDPTDIEIKEFTSKFLTKSL